MGSFETNHRSYPSIARSLCVCWPSHCWRLYVRSQRRESAHDVARRISSLAVSKGAVVVVANRRSVRTFDNTGRNESSNRSSRCVRSRTASERRREITTIASKATTTSKRQRCQRTIEKTKN